MLPFVCYGNTQWKAFISISFSGIDRGIKDHFFEKNNEKINMNLTSSLGVDQNDPDRQMKEKYIISE